MINIQNISVGWLNLTIGNRTFHVSYLTDVNKELDKVKDLQNCFSYENATPELLYFDGEGVELYLTVRKEYDDLIIIWEEHSREDKIILERMEFFYPEFLLEWNQLWNKIKEEYYKNFDLDTFMKEGWEEDNE
jgi:hypothetical protein